MSSVSFFEFPSPIMWWQLVLYYVAVAWGAFVIGCFGVGGGAIFVPAMLLLPGMQAPVAVGTVFVGCLPMSWSRAAQLHYYGRLNIRSAIPLMWGAIAGALIGQALLPHIPSIALAFFVATLAIFAGVQTQKKVMRDRRAKQAPPPKEVGGTPVGKSAEDEEASPRDEEASPAGPRVPAAAAVGPTRRETAAMVCVGCVASFLSSLSGTGGPLIFFPLWLLWDPNVSMKRLVATSSPFAVCLVTFSAVGALALGDVDIGLALGIMVVGTVASLCGGTLMERMGDSFLKLSVGFVLVLIGTVVGSRTVAGLLL